MARLSLGVLAGILAILTITTASVAIGKWHQERFEKEAVVISEGQLDVMEGPASDVKRFAIEEGSRVTLLDETDTWSKLLDSEGRDGWVPKKALGTI
jgi:SH3-like domain-containing protein